MTDCTRTSLYIMSISNKLNKTQCCVSSVITTTWMLVQKPGNLEGSCCRMWVLHPCFCLCIVLTKTVHKCERCMCTHILTEVHKCTLSSLL